MVYISSGTYTTFQRHVIRNYVNWIEYSKGIDQWNRIESALIIEKFVLLTLNGEIINVELQPTSTIKKIIHQFSFDHNIDIFFIEETFCKAFSFSSS